MGAIFGAGGCALVAQMSSRVRNTLKRRKEDGPNPRLASLLTTELAARLLRYFLESVKAAGGRFVHIPTGKARPQRQAAPAGSGGTGMNPRSSPPREPRLRLRSS